ERRRRHRAPDLPHPARGRGVRARARLRPWRPRMGRGAARPMVAAQETLIRGHAMPFGAAVLAQGGVRFRLWAPAAKTLEVVIGRRGRRMQRQPEGWYELVDRDAGPGTLYQYRIDRKQLVPDPASRFQPRDVDGPSEVIDPSRYPWKDAGWRSRPWNEAVI